MIGFRSAAASWLGFALALTGGLACSDARQPPQPASFDRPTDVDFVCVQGGHAEKLSRCDDFDKTKRSLHALVTQSARGEVAAVNLRTDRILDNRRDVPGYTFVPTGELPIALVVSRNHPEVTYVASYGSRDIRVMDTNVLLGLKSENEAGASIGDGALWQKPISLTIEGEGGSFGGTPTDMVLTPDEKVLLVTLSDVGKIARLPLDVENGKVDEAGITFIELPVVTPDAPAPVPTEDSYAFLCDYERPPLPPIPAVRPGVHPAPATAARPVALAIDVSCKGETCGNGRVLVADEALPVLHVLDLDALVAGSDPLLAPIPTGAPTRDVVVTPRVPATFAAGHGDEEPAAPEEPTTYFVYAIDGVDGSIMVLENDAVLAINHDRTGLVDRLPVASRSGAPTPLALALEVLTPEYNPQEPYVQFPVAPSGTIPGEGQYCKDDLHSEVTPRRLRGVFLSAAMADGTVRIIDVHDMDLQRCRSCDDATGKAAVLVRHNPRLAVDFIAENETDREELRSIAEAHFTVETGNFNVRSSGMSASPLAPELECISCADGFAKALPDPDDQVIDPNELPVGDDSADEDGGVSGDDALARVCRDALVCSLSDPWAAPSTLYGVSYEAVLSNAGSGDGRFLAPNDASNPTPGVLEFLSSVPFCARGVLGSDDIAGARDETVCQLVPTMPDGPVAAPLLGDQLWITSEPLSDHALDLIGRNEDDRRLCTSLRDELDKAKDKDDDTRITFDIIAAFEDRLAVQSQAGAIGSLSIDWEDIQRCMGDGALRFQVRSQSNFLVSTGNEGFLHNVIANDNGRCVVDAMSGPKHSRRAWTGCQYQDDHVQFELKPFATTKNVVEEPGGGKFALLTIGLGTTADQLVLNASQIGYGVTTLVPARLRYSATDGELYLVDTYQGGLIPIALDPFRDTPITSFY